MDIAKKRIIIYYLSLHRWQSKGSAGLGPTNKNLGGTHVLVPKMFLLMYLTLPVTSATSECTFSALRQLKNYLTSTMKQDCLNKLEQLLTVRCIVPNRWLRMRMTERKISPPPSPPTPSRFKTLRCLSFFCNVQWHISQRNFWSTPHNFPRTTN